MEDVQKQTPANEVPIQRVGITDLKLPIFLKTKNGNGSQHTVANIDMFVDLAANERGTHMSRLPLCIHKYSDKLFCVNLLKEIVLHVREELRAQACQIIYRFPYFMLKKAPVTDNYGTDYCEVMFDLTYHDDKFVFVMSVEVLSTSLCPCSREISTDGAHNQRAKIKITCEPKEDAWIWIEDLVALAEQSASCEIYPVLKRPDEKYITEKAYNNAQFVEDIVRSLELKMRGVQCVRHKLEVTSEESIHHHNAYAKITQGHF